MSEMPLFPLWFTMFLAIWGLVGPVAGIFIGHYLSRAWQRKQWMADNAKQECREVISTMTRTFSVLVDYWATPSDDIPLSGPHDSGEMRERAEAYRDSLEVFYDKLFIGDQLNERKIRNRWIAAINEFEANKDNSKFATEFGTLVAEVQVIAKKIIQ